MLKTEKCTKARQRYRIRLRQNTGIHFFMLEYKIQLYDNSRWWKMSQSQSVSWNKVHFIWSLMLLVECLDKSIRLEEKSIKSQGQIFLIFLCNIENDEVKFWWYHCVSRSQSLRVPLTYCSHSPSHKYYLATDPVTGAILLSDTNSRRVYRVKSTTVVKDIVKNSEVVAGTGDQCLPFDDTRCGDGGKATEASLNNPRGNAGFTSSRNIAAHYNCIWKASYLHVRLIFPIWVPGGFLWTCIDGCYLPAIVQLKLASILPKGIRT